MLYYSSFKEYALQKKISALLYLYKLMQEHLRVHVRVPAMDPVGSRFKTMHF